MSGTGQRVAAIVTELSEQFFERDDVLRPIACAVLARQHALLVGPPGAAKSDLARVFCARITGAVYWETQLSRFTDPKQIFGPINVPELMKGNYTQVFEGHATQADIAFIDEIFKCSDGALNSMLGFLNERLYHPEQGGDPIPCPLISAVTASNELPAGEDLAAIYDRLLVRLVVDYIKDPGNFITYLRSSVTPPAAAAATATVSVDALRAAIETEVPAVKVPNGVVDSVASLRAALRQGELIFSDRRWKQAVRLLQASAYLDGRDTADDNDLDVLRYVLWDTPAQRQPAEEAILTLVNPDAKDVFTLLAGISDVEAELDSRIRENQSAEELSSWWHGEAMQKMSMAKRKLRDMRTRSLAAGRSTAKIDDARARHHAVCNRVMVEALDMDPDLLPPADA